MMIITVSDFGDVGICYIEAPPLNDLRVSTFRKVESYDYKLLVSIFNKENDMKAQNKELRFQIDS